MDDEATIRVTLIIVVGIIVFTTVVVMGLNWAPADVPLATQRTAQATATGYIRGCRSLPVTSRLVCLQTWALRSQLGAAVTGELRQCARITGTRVKATEILKQCVATVAQSESAALRSLVGGSGHG